MRRAVARLNAAAHVPNVWWLLAPYAILGAGGAGIVLAR